MTTSTFYGNTTDGVIYSMDSNALGQPEASEPNYTLARAGTGSSITAYTGMTTGLIGQQGQAALGFWDDEFQQWDPYGSATKDVYQMFLSFTTSDIPDTDSISSVTLSLWIQSIGQDGVWTAEVRAKAWGSSLTTSDYVAGANLSTLTLLASLAKGSMVGAQYNAFTSEADFNANVSKIGDTEMMVHGSRDRVGDGPPGFDPNGWSWLAEAIIYLADDSGTTHDPKLVVVHSSDSTLPIPENFEHGVVSAGVTSANSTFNTTVF